MSLRTPIFSYLPKLSGMNAGTMASDGASYCAPLTMMPNSLARLEEEKLERSRASGSPLSGMNWMPAFFHGLGWGRSRSAATRHSKVPPQVKPHDFDLRNRALTWGAASSAN